MRSSEERIVQVAASRRMGARAWPGRAPTLVFLHGLLDSADGWDMLAQALPQRCVALDLPGFGHSDRVPTARIAAYAKAVFAALDALNVDECVVVGHSLGGAIATDMAERAPDRVLGLILLAPAGFGRIPLAEAISIPGLRNLAAAALPFALANPAIVAAAYSGVVTSGRRPDPRLLARVTRSARHSVGGARDGTQAVVVAGLAKRGFHQRRVRYAGPVHAVWGSADHLVPHSHMAALKRSLPQTEIEVWRGMGHHPQAERPRKLQALVAAVCAEVRRPRRRASDSDSGVAAA